MQISFQISSQPPALDEIDEYAKILFQVFDEGLSPDMMVKGVFTKPYTRFEEYSDMNELQKQTFYCDKAEEVNGEKIVQSYVWREWGVNAQKILTLLAKKKEDNNGDN